MAKPFAAKSDAAEIEGHVAAVRAERLELRRAGADDGAGVVPAAAELERRRRRADVREHCAVRCGRHGGLQCNVEPGRLETEFRARFLLLRARWNSDASAFRLNVTLTLYGYRLLRTIMRLS